MSRIPVRLKNSDGFALAMAIFALVVLAAVVAGGYFSAAQEFQIGRGMRSVTSSFYAGESGINEIIENWDGLAFGALAAGDSALIGPVTFEGGGSYTAIVKRVGIAADSDKRYFYIEAVGRPPAPARGERRQAVIVRARFPDLCCSAAVTVVASVDLTGGGPSTEKIVGDDAGPPLPNWTAACTAFPPQNSTGLVVPNSSIIIDPIKVTGSPDPIVVNSAINSSNILNQGDLSYAELLQLADFVFPGGTFNGTQPTLTGDAKCDRSNPNNWGEPRDSNHPCFNYFPVIRVTSDLNLAGPGVGQGILLIGNPGDNAIWLSISGQFEFYGLIYTTNGLLLSGGADVFGGVYVEDTLQVGASPPRISHNRCAVERAVRLSSISRPQMLPGRSWVELF